MGPTSISISCGPWKSWSQEWADPIRSWRVWRKCCWCHHSPLFPHHSSRVATPTPGPQTGKVSHTIAPVGFNLSSRGSVSGESTRDRITTVASSNVTLSWCFPPSEHNSSSRWSVTRLPSFLAGTKQNTCFYLIWMEATEWRTQGSWSWQSPLLRRWLLTLNSTDKQMMLALSRTAWIRRVSTTRAGTQHASWISELGTGVLCSPPPLRQPCPTCHLCHSGKRMTCSRDPRL